MQRPVRAAVLVLLLAAPLSLASAGPAFTLVAAELSAVSDAPSAWGVPPNAHYRLDFTIRNDGGSGVDLVAVDEYWVVFDLPSTAWHEWAQLAAGETRSWSVDIDYNGVVTIPGPSWLCLEAGFSNGRPARCWSIMTGAPLAGAAYPEDIPHWQLMGTPMGDTP